MDPKPKEHVKKNKNFGKILVAKAAPIFKLILSPPPRRTDRDFEKNGAGSKNGAVQFFISEMKSCTNTTKERAEKCFYQNSYILERKTCREAFDHRDGKRAFQNLYKIVKFRRMKRAVQKSSLGKFNVE